jgi:predicted NBD/HSP70 family sugar kinase
MTKVTSQQLLKSINQQKVLHLIYNEGPISRVELAQRTGLTQQTVTNVVKRLLQESLVSEGEDASGRGGGKPIPLTVNSSRLFAIGIEVAVKYVRGTLVNFRNEVIGESRVDNGINKNEEQPLDSIRQVVRDLLGILPDHERLYGIGCSVQGLVDAKQGVVIRSPGLAWRNFPLREKLRHEFGFPVFIENDVNLMATIENLQGLLSGAVNSLILKMDYGIGGAIIFGNQLYPGASHVAGEFGHYKVFTGEDALPCHCGGRGCLTTLASISGLKGNKKMSLGELNRKVRDRDTEACVLYALISKGIGLALCNLVAFLNPDHVLLAGKLIETLGDLLIPELRRELQESVPESCRSVRLLHVQQEVNEAKLATGLVMKHFFEVPVDSLAL